MRMLTTQKPMPLTPDPLSTPLLMRMHERPVFPWSPLLVLPSIKRTFKPILLYLILHKHTRECPVIPLPLFPLYWAFLFLLMQHA